MEYQSPLGFNFKLKECSAKDDGNLSKSAEKMQKCSTPHFLNDRSYDGLRVSYDNIRKDHRRGSHHDRGDRWNSSGQFNRSGVHCASSSVADYYSSSMMEDPWKELEGKPTT